MMPMMSWLSATTWLLLAVLVLAVAVAATVVAVVGRSSGRSGAEEQLRARYARGEIDDDEYQTRLALLRSARGGRR